MDKKTIGIIATISTALLCGCPGACIILFGAVSAVGTSTSEFGGATSQISTGSGIIMLCLGIILFLIPIIVAFFSFRPEKKAGSEVLDAEEVEEELPPAI